MNTILVINSPMFVMVSSRKKFILNINNYRNTDKYTLNRAKKAYHDIVYYDVMKLPVFKKARGTMTLFPSRLCDVDNVLSIHSKFLLDVLPKCGKLKDDNYKYYLGTTPAFGGVDKKNPRVEVEFVEVL